MMIYIEKENAKKLTTNIIIIIIIDEFYLIKYGNLIP